MVELNDGTVLKDARAFEGSKELFIYIDDTTLGFKDIADLLLDKNTTAKVIYSTNGVNLVFEGYTNLTFLQVGANGSLARLSYAGREV